MSEESDLQPVIKKVKTAGINKQAYDAYVAQSMAKAKVKAAAQEKIPQLERLTDEEWAALDGKARWDSIVALRGPDVVNSQTVKWFTSSVIRHRLSGVMRTGGLVNSRLPFVVLPSGQVALPADRRGFDYQHFSSHIYEAATWLKVPIAYVSGEAWGKMLGRCSHVQALFAFLPELQEPFKEYAQWYLTGQGYDPDKPAAGATTLEEF